MMPYKEMTRITSMLQLTPQKASLSGRESPFAFLVIPVLAISLLAISANAATMSLTAGESPPPLINFAHLDDIHQVGFPIAPKTRPDFADAWGGEPVEIESPHSRPNLLDMLPQTTPAIDQMVAIRAGHSVGMVTELTLSRGDTLAKLLKRAHFTNQDIASVSSALAGRVDLRKLQIGTKFTAALDTKGRGVALQLHLLNTESVAAPAGRVFVDHYVIRHDYPESPTLTDWQAIRAIRPVDIQAVHAGNEIRLSLHESAKQVLIPPSILDEFVGVMSFSVDFQREIQQGDKFELIYEKSIDKLTGKILSTGSLQYAGIVLSGEKIGFYRFIHPNGAIGWYDRKGHSAVRTLMRTPVNGARLSSGYGMRRHPLTGYSAMHRGIDFAVPKGTPILAAGTGRIESAGWNGSYGRYIRIRHNSTYKTAYAHLSRIASHVKRGSTVQQGEVIGYVGSSGRSTGAHLHYEILVNNRQLNPMTVKLPTGKGLPEHLFPNFAEQIDKIEQIMSDSITPLYAGVSLQQAALNPINP